MEKIEYTSSVQIPENSDFCFKVFDNGNFISCTNQNLKNKLIQVIPHFDFISRNDIGDFLIVLGSILKNSNENDLAKYE